MAFATTDEIYYENPEHWGEDAFVTLENVIDNIIALANDDSYLKKEERFRLSIIGKMGLKKLEVDIKSDNKAINFQLAPSKIFPYPRYMTNWSRIGVINSCGKLEILNINNSPLVHDYLQDNDYALLYDNDGAVLEATSFNVDEGTCQLEIYNCKDKDIVCSCDNNTTCQCGGSKYAKSWVKPVKEGNYFEFSDDLVDAEIVIEFKTASLRDIDDCDVKIHHDLELTVMRYIQWNALMGKRNTTEREWRSYKAEYKAERKRSNRLLAQKINLDRIYKSISLRY